MRPLRRSQALLVLRFHGGFAVEPLSECPGRRVRRTSRQAMYELNGLIGTWGANPRFALQTPPARESSGW
jgi:hypothetical protein